MGVDAKERQKSLGVKLLARRKENGGASDERGRSLLICPL